jgi:type VI secretion system protein ImpF
MAELTSQERLQPSLLDRLTDEEPNKKVESREQRILSTSKLRDCVVRDLLILLNTCHLAATEDLDAHPEIAGSVVNFGIPDLTGVTASSVDARGLERALRQAIWDFEPRILRNTLKVVIRTADEVGPQALVCEVEGEIWGDPTPVHISLQTQLNLDTGAFCSLEVGD